VATPDKARLKEVKGGKELTFRFNPKEVSIAKSATWNRPTNKGAKSASTPEFGGVQPQTIQMELFFDDFEHPDKDLTKDIQQLMDWLKPTPKAINQNKPQPKVLQLLWGNNRAVNGFHGFLKSVNAKYTMFKSDGRPIRATAQITLEEIPNEPKKQNPTSGAISSQRTHVMVAGDSLMSVAYREYDDPSLWRGLASFNGIDDPLRARSGSSLLIPTEDEARSLVAPGENS
jgi:nucleoid-associated protein YgaU